MINPALIGIFNSSRDIAFMMEWVINERGYDTTSLIAPLPKYDPTGSEANLRKFLKEKAPQVLIFDVPDIDSWEVFSSIRESEEARDCRFILTTTRPDKIKQLTEGSIKPVRVIEMPLDIDEFLKDIKEELFQGEHREGHPSKETNPGL